jgi:hypothetical protein
VDRRELRSEQLLGCIVEDFGVNPQVAQRAFEILKRKG